MNKISNNGPTAGAQAASVPQAAQRLFHARRLPRWVKRVAFVSSLTVLVLAGLPGRAIAQSGVGDIVYTVGTVTRDSFGRDWAYILWQATDPGSISNRVFAIYAKPGDPTNTAAFVRQSVVTLQTDARVIEPLLRRAENLGDDQNKLQDDLTQLFGNLMPSNSIARADRLSAVIRGSMKDPRSYQNLLLLARNHAGINLALGFADAEIIPVGRTTFEVRAFDPKGDKDLAVIGRVTVQAGSPTILPQPGSPVLVPEQSAMGDLNLRLRWGTPDELRRLGLMQFGYNLYRVEKTYAATRGWSAAVRPPLAALLPLTTNSPALARRVNRVPITPAKVFTATEAFNVSPPGDTNTFFIMDDDGRGRPGYVNYNFTNGSQYYYYVAARDVLGRDGDLSFGLLATVCDRMPPMPPRSVAVLNDYVYNTATKTSNQALRVVWRQSPNTNEQVTNYWVYRWTNINEMNLLSGGISNNLIAVVPHLSNVTFNSYLDSGPTSPKIATDAGKTYWYTVRAGDAGACGQNLSGPGGPAFGVLRDRIGPGAGAGVIEINCLRPIVQFRSATLSGVTNVDFTTLPFLLACNRFDSRCEWAEFYAFITYNSATTNFTTSNYFRVYFMGDNAVSAWWTPPRSPDGGQYSWAVNSYCRAGLYGGKVSNFAFADIKNFPLDRNYELVTFDAFARIDRVVAGSRGNDDCREHQPGGDGGGPSGTNDITIHIFPPFGSLEYRLYRRIDDGPVTLFCQGATTNVLDCIDNAAPANGGTICYYLQCLDEHGNPGPMTPLVPCITTAPKTPLPKPTLAKITPTGDAKNPGMNISWFCPPYGVDRFEVFIAGTPTGPGTNDPNFSPLIKFTGEPPLPLTFSDNGSNVTLSFFPAITPKVGPGFGNNGATFMVSAAPILGKRYAVAVRAKGKNGNAGEFSNFETFLWNTTNIVTPQVPWPARPVPSTNANFSAIAFFLSPTNASEVLRTSGYTGNAVLVGLDQLPTRTIITRQGNATITGVYDPNAAVATNTAGEPFFPVAMYRYQVPNVNFPTVSGDVTQVSPLMEVIAYQVDTSAGKTNTVVQDPFIASTGLIEQHDIFFWLRDTQPQISGARYRYVLVRFRKDHEIDQLVVSNEVEVP